MFVDKFRIILGHKRYLCRVVVLKSLVYQMELPSTIVQDVRRQVSNHVLLDLEFVGCVSWNHPSC